MIPVSLKIRGFLSYRDEVEVDLSLVDVACVSGSNGAGKSSLFDAMTWALFGRARRSDDALINDASESCAVTIEFEYERDRYRVLREKTRGKAAELEFQIQTADGAWKPLTEAGLRATEERIRDVLRLDYDTFINASFFLQGKADMFTQQAPARRKEILGNILGLDVWEAYREEAALRRRSASEEVKAVRGLLADIEEELGQEQERQERLKLLSDNLNSLAALRAEKEQRLSEAQKQAYALSQDAEKLNLLTQGLEGAQSRLTENERRIAELSALLGSFEATLAKEGDIEARHHQWLELRGQLDRWNDLSQKSHNLENARGELEAVVRAEDARLRQERESLTKLKNEMTSEEAKEADLLSQLRELEARQSTTVARLTELPELEERAAEAQNRQGALSAENKTLREQMEDLKERISHLEGLKGGACPLCGQNLSDDHKQEILGQYKEEGKRLGDQYRANEQARQGLRLEVEALAQRVEELKNLRADSAALGQTIAGSAAQVEALQARKRQWEQQAAPRLAEVEQSLAQAAFAPAERERMAALEDEIAALGYDQAAHANTRQAESQTRSVETEFQTLEKARATAEGLKRELSTLEESRVMLDEEVQSRALAAETLRREMAQKSAALPDVDDLERGLESVRRDENTLRTQVGAAQQMLSVLENQRKRQAGLIQQVDSLTRQISRLKMLETAFGKDGVPALLIEQALPEIEMQANELLDRLSDGRMSVSFETEREFKDKKREDKRQTLDILISDAAGRREYELFSGGEAFRINFAIRLALSRILAGRAGARLQTLVIDEGFGSQDAEGRQRLIEAINMVRQDFAKILVITHLEELKDAFPSRIEVTKENGRSRVEVIA